MTIYDPKTDDRTFDDHKGPQAAFPAMTEADHAMAYAKDAFKRLTGYSVEDRGASKGADGAMAYAEDIFARMRGRRMDHLYDFDYHLHRCHDRDGYVAREGRVPGAQAERAMTYAGDVFGRLRGLPAPELLGSNRRQDEVRQHRRQHPSRAGGDLRDDGRRHRLTISAAKTVSSCLSRFLLLAIAVGRAMMRLARRSVLEPYARRRRRRIAIAQLKALDNRLLADIGVRRNDIEWIVDRLLANRDNTMATPAALSPPAEDRRDDRRLAA